MQTIALELPDRSTRSYVEHAAAAGGYDSIQDYILGLIAVDRAKRNKEKLEALLLESLKDEARPITAADWEELRQNLIAKFGPVEAET